MTLFLQIHWWIIVNDCSIKEQLYSSLWLRFKYNNQPLLSNTRSLFDNKEPLLRNSRPLFEKVFEKFGCFTFIHLFCNCSLSEVSLLGGIEGRNLYIEKAYLTLCA